MKTNTTGLNRVTIILMVLTIFLSFPYAIAQSAMALYIKAENFVNNNPSFIKGKNNCKIKIHDFSFKSPVKVTYGKSTLHFSKDSLYGYKDHAGNFHRFFRKRIYECLNPTEHILLYRVTETIGYKYQPPTYTYYFSKDASSPIFLLTINNLERSFQENNKFLTMLEVGFKYDSALLEYDENYNMYKLNRMLQLSEIKNN